MMLLPLEKMYGEKIWSCGDFWVNFYSWVLKNFRVEELKFDRNYKFFKFKPFLQNFRVVDLNCDNKSNFDYFFHKILKFNPKISHKSHCHRYSVHSAYMHIHFILTARQTTDEEEKNIFNMLQRELVISGAFLCLVWLYLGNNERKIIFLLYLFRRKMLRNIDPLGLYFFPLISLLWY
jgi:hypothetical protein